jgi:hypothetical protein
MDNYNAQYVSPNAGVGFSHMLSVKKKLLPCFIAVLLAVCFCSSCENPWMKEILDPFFNIVYKIGDIGPGGGKIFYKSEAGFLNTYTSTICHYLEAAPNDANPECLVWAENSSNAYSFAYYYVPDNFEAIGTGRKNTANIIETEGTDLTKVPAANACINYRGINNLTDWFLPSKDELNELYKQKAIYNNWKTIYWSSSQAEGSEGPINAYIQYFQDNYVYNMAAGSQNQGDKGSEGFAYVRPIRAF